MSKLIFHLLTWSMLLFITCGEFGYLGYLFPCSLFSILAQNPLALVAQLQSTYG